MDPLSLSASIIAVLGLVNGCIKVGKATYEGITGDLSREIKSLTNNLTLLSGVLEDLKHKAEEQNSSLQSRSSSFHGIHSSGLIGSALEDCQRELGELLGFVLKQQRYRSGWKRVWRKATWPYKEKETKRWTDRIEAYKSTFSLALLKDTKEDTGRIVQDTAAISTDTQQLCLDSTKILAETQQTTISTTNISKDTQQLRQDTTQLLDESQQTTLATTNISNDTQQLRLDSMHILAETRQTNLSTAEVSNDTRQLRHESTQILDETRQTSLATTHIANDTKHIKQMSVDTREIGDRTQRLGNEIESLRLIAEKEEQRAAIEREQKAREKQRRKNRDIYRWLSAAHPEDNQAAARKLHTEGTGKWFLDGEEFREWKAKEGAFLWLNGIPGAGKTILSSAIIDDLTGAYKATDTVLAYFYSDFRDTSKHTARNIFSSLTSQIFRSTDATIPDEIVDIYDKDPYKPPTLEDTKQYLKLAIAIASSTVIVVDALDECSERAELLDGLLEMYEEYGEGEEGENKKVSMLLTSRCEQDIKTAFSELPALAIKSDDTEGDISKFVVEELERHPKLQRLKPEMKQEIVSTLADGSRGIFRWASCSLSQISKLRTDKAIKAALQTLPKDLFETYQRVLDSIQESDQSLAKRVFNWLVCTCRPLRLTEIVEAIAIEFDQTKVERDGVMNDPQEVLEICSSLVTFDEKAEVVVLAHFSVQEFFVSRYLREEIGSAFYVQKTEIDAVLARVCIVYLCFEEFREGICPTQKTWRRRLEDFPFYEYAAAYWPRHAKISAPDSAQHKAYISTALTFFDRDLSHDCWSAWLQTYTNHGSEWFDKYIRTDNVGHNRLLWASRLGLYSLSLALISNGADIHAQCDCSIQKFGSDYDNKGTALNAAVHAGHIDIVNLLLDNGADINLVATSTSLTPLHVAITESRYQRKDVQMEIINILLARSADPHQVVQRGDDCRNAVSVAVGTGHAKALRRFLELGVDATIPNSLGHPPVVAATLWTEHKSLELYDILREFGATRVPGPVGFAPDGTFEAAAFGLWLLIGENHNDAVKGILRAEAKEIFQDAPHGIYHTIRSCAGCGKTEILRELLDAADRCGWDGRVEGETLDVFVKAAVEAALYNRTEEMKILLTTMQRRGLEKTSGRGLIPAIGRMNPDVVRILLEHGADPDFLDEHGWSPMLCGQSYAERGRESVLLLSKHGASTLDAVPNPKIPGAWKHIPRILEPYPKPFDIEGCGDWIDVTYGGGTGSSVNVWGDHPIPPTSTGRFFYFEAEILSLPSAVGKTSTPDFSIGLIDAQYIHDIEDIYLRAAPGNTKMSLFYCSSGSLRTFREQDVAFGPSYGVGAVVGCAVDIQRQVAVFVLNGKIIQTGACRAVRGMLFPIMSLNPGVSVRTRLGKEIGSGLMDEFERVEVKYDFYSNIGYVEPPEEDGAGGLLTGVAFPRGSDYIR